MLGYDDAQSFETTRINNHSVTEKSAQVLLGDNDAHSFEIPPPQKKIIVSLHQRLIRVSLTIARSEERRMVNFFL